MAESTIAMIITVVALLFWITEIFPIGVTAVAVCIALALTKTVSFTTAFSGFSSSLVMMISGMMVVGHALFKTGVAQLIGNAIVRRVGNHQLLAMALILSTAGIMSGFLSNVATMSMFIPVIAGIAATSKGAISGKHIYMPLSWAVNAGGMMTLVGSTPQLVAQGVLLKTGYAGFDVFGFIGVGLPLLVITVLYSCTLGLMISKKVFAGSLEAFMAAEQAAAAADTEAAAADKAPDKKVWIAAATMVLMILLFVTLSYHNYSVGVVGMLGAAVIIMSGCVSEKEAFRAIDWPTIMVMAGSMGLADALEKTGAGQIIASTVLGWMGASATPYALFVVITLLAAVLTQIMSCTGTAAMLTPIACFMAKSMGIAPHGIVVGIIMGGQVAMMTPVGSAPAAMVIGPGQYGFMDYVKMGTLLTVFLTVATVILVPVFFPL